MNIDEKIEALTMNLDLLTRDVHEMHDSMREWHGHLEEMRGHMVEMRGHMGELIDVSMRTLEMMQAHERRLTCLERNEP